MQTFSKGFCHLIEFLRESIQDAYISVEGRCLSFWENLKRHSLHECYGLRVGILIQSSFEVDGVALLLSKTGCYPRE